MEVIEREVIVNNDNEIEDQRGQDVVGAKKDKIFGYSNFNEFRSKYFRKEVDAFEEKKRLKDIKEARVKYAKRNNGPMVNIMPANNH